MSADPEARFTGEYETYYGRVRAYTARRVGADAADELTAEVFTIAWRRLRDIPEEPLPWLYGVAGNLVKRHRQGLARDRDTDQALRLERPPIPSSEPEWPGLWEAWERLSPSDQEVLALTAWEELPARDAAAVLGCSAALFSVRLHRARRRFERLLAQAPPSAANLSRLSEAR